MNRFYYVLKHPRENDRLHCMIITKHTPHTGLRIKSELKDKLVNKCYQVVSELNIRKGKIAKTFMKLRKS